MTPRQPSPHSKHSPFLRREENPSNIVAWEERITFSTSKFIVLLLVHTYQRTGLVHCVIWPPVLRCCSLIGWRDYACFGALISRARAHYRRSNRESSGTSLRADLCSKRRSSCGSN